MTLFIALLLLHHCGFLNFFTALVSITLWILHLSTK